MLERFNDGVCGIYRVDNIAEPGDKPKDGLVPKLPYLRYQERVVGVKRFYAAAQANAKIDRVIRIARQRLVSNQDCVILSDGQYHIRQVQHKNDTQPPCTDLTLERVTVNYDIKPI